MKKLKSLLIFLACTFLGMELQAQWTVTGKVTDAATQETMPGVNIQEVGSSDGAITDLDGNYSIKLKSPNAQLSFSFIGYQDYIVNVDGRANIDIVMSFDQEQLEEVVVIGYGAQKKKLLTGATVNVSSENLINRSNTNALQALQGQTAGVNITSTSGQPGAGLQVNIRGVGTIGNSSPLFIVDGMPTGDISYLNNSDIQSVDILKDAASSAIYGSRAANGVVLITTKKGSAGRTQVTFDSYVGSQSIARKYEVLNSREYAALMNEQAVNSGKAPLFSNQQIAQMGEGTDWLSEIFADKAMTQNYALGIQGGNAASSYSASASFTNQEGIIGGGDFSNYDRYVFRINSEHKLIGDYVKFGENLTYNYVNQIGIPDGGQYYNHIRGAFNVLPFMPVYDENGEFYNNAGAAFIDGGTQANPYANLVYNNQKVGSRQGILGNAYLQFNVLKNLSFKSNIGITNSSGQSRSYTPVYELSIYSRVDTNSVNQSSSRDISWNWENTVNYLTSFGKNNIDVLVGTTAQKWNGSGLSARNANLVFDDIRYAYLDNTTYANGVRQDVGGYGYEDALLSYFGRVLFNHDEKYLFSATMRADGSAKFAPGNRWGYFPSFSAGWVITNEDFMDGANLPIDFLKLRASWGQNGSNFVSGFQYLAPIQLNNTNYSFGIGEGSLTPGAFPNRLSNEKIHWETSEQLDFGVDAEFINGRLFANLDWYRKNTKDWLIQAPILATAGADAPFINGGDVINTGIEAVVGFRNNQKKLKYNVSANVAYNKNEVRNIPTVDQTIHGQSNELWNNAPEFYRASVGRPIGYFWGYQTAGIFQTEADVAAYKGAGGKILQPAALPGDLKLVDTNGDGIINNDDKTIIGDPNPDFIFGLSFSAQYGAFDFGLSANGVAGNQIVQSYRDVSNQFSNYPVEILNRWHGNGSSNTLPRLTEDGRNYSIFSDLYVKDGDFIRINNVTLGYDLKEHIRTSKIGKLRLFVSGQNLLTLTRYTGMDPEIGYGQSFAKGVDIGYYPRPRTLLAGLNVTF